MMTTTPPKRTFKRGDVALVLFPNSDLISSKTRPALIVQSDDLRTELTQIVVAMITSQMLRAGYLSRVVILLNSPEGQQSGLLTDSIVMSDNLATITHSAIYRVIGTLPMTNVDKALQHTLGLK